LLAVEDARVNELARRAGLGDVIFELDDPTLEEPEPGRELRAATLLLVAAHGTRAFDRVHERLADHGDAGRVACNLARRAVKLFVESKKPPGFVLTVIVARMLDRLLGLADPLSLPSDGLEPLLLA